MWCIVVDGKPVIDNETNRAVVFLSKSLAKDFIQQYDLSLNLKIMECSLTSN
jgi:hypothetical protein